MRVELEKMEDIGYGKKEALNSLRTNLSFCGDDIHVIAFTSCTPDEGKSSTVVELGRSMAQDHMKVLVIDCDLRKSVLVGRHRAVSQEGAIKGVSHYLTKQATLDEVICETNIKNLDVVFAGRSTPNPTQLLNNRYFDELMEYARAHYDMVLIDTPPLGSVIDAAIVAPKTDGVVIVVEVNKCSYKFIADVKKQIELTDTRILGVVLNKIQIEKKGYYNRYYKGYYSGYYNQDENAKDNRK